jgi:hypothetical protein
MSRSVKRRKRKIKRRCPPVDPRWKKKFNRRKRNLIYKNLERRIGISKAVELAGITVRTYRQWMEKGKDKRNPVHRHFRYRVKKIMAQAEIEALDIIRKAAEGGNKIIETKVSTGPKGTETTRTWKVAAPQWTAAAWFLERCHKERYSRDAKDPEKEKSAEEQAGEIKKAADALFDSVPVNEDDVDLPEDMPD